MSSPITATGRSDTDDYLALFLNDTPLIDTRAPIEFARGAFPGAVNLPLMSDSEREQVGSCYKTQGQQAAIALGHQLVNGKRKEARVQQWQSFAEQHPQGYLYCFRGGLRSQICQQWLSDIGCAYPRVSGGFKAMRNFLLGTLEQFCKEGKIIVLAGHTGSAKTEVLSGIPGAVDLEAMANHRGSAFGRRATEQPSQIDFENRVIIAMLRNRHSLPDRPLILEDESRLIGRCAVPPILREAMSKAPLVQLERDLESRTEHSYVNYILRKSAEWQQQAGEQQGFELFIQDLRDSLFKVRKRLGGERYADIHAQLEDAIAHHQRGDPTHHRQWIHALLKDYYDPMYTYQGQKHHERVIFSGDHKSVSDFLRAQ